MQVQRGSAPTHYSGPAYNAQPQPYQPPMQTQVNYQPVPPVEPMRRYNIDPQQQQTPMQYQTDPIIYQQGFPSQQPRQQPSSYAPRPMPESSPMVDQSFAPPQSQPIVYQQQQQPNYGGQQPYGGQIGAAPMTLNQPASGRTRQGSGSRVPMLRLAGSTAFGGLPVSPSPHKIPTGRRRWTMDQLRQTDGIVPLQSGTNQFASQKGMTAMGMTRNTKLKIEENDPNIRPAGDVLPDVDPNYRIGRFTVGQLRASDGIIPSQYGTNQFASQKGTTGFGTPRDVSGKHLHRFWDEEVDYGDDYYVY